MQGVNTQNHVMQPLETILIPHVTGFIPSTTFLTSTRVFRCLLFTSSLVLSLFAVTFTVFGHSVDGLSPFGLTIICVYVCVWPLTSSVCMHLYLCLSTLAELSTLITVKSCSFRPASSRHMASLCVSLLYLRGLNGFTAVHFTAFTPAIFLMTLLSNLVTHVST